MHDVSMSHDIVKLNVGGVVHTTTRVTLSHYPHSMLGAMFNGSLHSTKDSDGCYFIDRDGHLFTHVLNFLRSSQLNLPDDFKLLDPLLAEADFYQIEPMIKALTEVKRQREASRRSRKGRLLEVIELRTGSTATMPTKNSRVKTVVIGRNDVVGQLPPQLIERPMERLQKDDLEFSELTLCGSNVRVKLGEYLQDNGWTLLDSNMSSSSGYDSKSMPSDVFYWGTTTIFCSTTAFFSSTTAFLPSTTARLATPGPYCFGSGVIAGE